MQGMRTILADCGTLVRSVFVVTELRERERERERLQGMLGLPLSVQLAAPTFQERVLGIMHSLERALTR